MEDARNAQAEAAELMEEELRTGDFLPLLKAGRYHALMLPLGLDPKTCTQPWRSGRRRFTLLRHAVRAANGSPGDLDALARLHRCGELTGTPDEAKADTLDGWASEMEAAWPPSMSA